MTTRSMTSKTSTLSPAQNSTITIQTLRENAGEMLRVADHLEATQRFIGNGSHVGIPGKRQQPYLVPQSRHLTKAARAKIAKASKARWAQKRAAVGKTVAA